ncbi:MAG: type I polyketide synthase, partial [Deltaproteobacteria bacterium]|nr:type I polyketide synthase [Deltaproteobacteria bacterium]
SAVALLRAVLQVKEGRWLGAPAPGSPAAASPTPRRVGINGFGGGGAAYHVVVGALTDAELRGPPPVPAPPCTSVPVAVVSLGAFLPGAPDVRTARELLAAGESQAAPFPAEAWEGYREAFFSADPDAAEDTSHGELAVRAGPLPAALGPFLEQAGIPPVVSGRMDVNHLHLLETARQMVEDKGWRRQAAERTGVVLGESTSSMRGAWRLEKRMAFRAFEETLRPLQAVLAPGLDERGYAAKVGELKARLLADTPPVDEDSGPGILVPLTAERIAQFVNARGGGASLDAACASSLAALLAGVRDLRLGKVDAVIGAGVGLSVGPVANILFSRCQALSARWSRPFDESADGILLGEGCVGFVLKRLEDAQRDGDTVHAVIEGVGASSDGRGTAIMAPSAEGQGRAVRRALADAGLSPSAVDWVECHATGTPVGDYAEVHSLAAGYETARRDRPLGLGSSKVVWGHTVGAAGAVGLLKVTSAFRTGAIPPTPLATKESPHLELAANNLVVPQQAAPWRPAPGRVRRAGLSSFGFGGTNWHVVLREPPPSPARGWCFVFPGHGSPYPGMGRVLYEQSAAFRAAIAEANETLVPLLGRTFEQALYGGTDESQTQALFATESVQPLILACNVAFYRAARELGLKPAWVMGHSVGEFSAAVAAGMLALPDGLRLAHARGRLYRARRDAGEDTGAMLAVLAGAPAVRRALDPFPDGVGVAALNSPGQVVLSGPTPGVAAAAEQLAARGLSAVPLPVEVAWHSELVHAQGAAGLRAALKDVAFHPPRVPLIRCAGAQVLAAGAPLEGAYREGFVSQLREPVDFVRMAEAAWAAGVRRFLEVGPRTTLSGFLRDIFAGRGAEALTSDVPKRPGFEGLLRAVAADGVAHGG